jgi:hypothetical protein
MRRRRAVALLLAGVFAGAPASALASPYTAVLHAYQTFGSVPPCRFSSPELAAALRGVDTYGQQYFADFSDAVQTALAARAAGACAPAGPHGAGTTAGAEAPLPASATAPTAGSPPLAILLLAGLTLLIAALVGASALARSRGWEPAWAAGCRHAWGELGYLAEGRWAELSERWRGRRS